MNDIRLGKERLKPRRKKRFDIDSLQLYSLCLIPVLLVFVFNYIPMGGIIIAFKNYKYDLGIFRSDWVGLANFKYFISSSDFARVSFNTIYINFLNIIFGTTASLFLAILLYDIKSRKTVKNAERGYKEINYKAMKLLPRGGYLATCSCSHFMKDELFVKMLISAAKDAGGQLKQIEARQQACDHPILWNVPETDYLKFYIFQIV